MIHYKTKSTRYFKLFQDLSFQELQKVMSLSEMTLDAKIKKDILEKHDCVMSFQDLLFFLEKDSTLSISDPCFIKIIESIPSKNELAWKIFTMTVTKKNHLEYYLDPVLDYFFSDMPTALTAPMSVYQVFLEHSLKYGFIDYFKILLSKFSTVLLSRNYFRSIYKLGDDNNTLLSKMENINEYISFVSHYKYEIAIRFTVDPLDLSKILREIIENYLSFLLVPNQIIIEYDTPKGKVGYDAGGLTKDFYDLISKDIQKQMILEDDFYTPINSDNDDVWYIYGVFFCRSIFIENISPHFALHPTICFFLIHGIQNLHLSDFLKTMSSYNIEYFINLEKIFKMEKSEYIDFLEMQDHHFVSKKKYIQSILSEKYLSTNTLNFIQGFRDTFDNIYGNQYITLGNFISFVHGRKSYCIFGKDSTSLESNLSIINKVKTINTEQFKQKFLQTIHDMNHEQQMKFFKFWFGSSGLSTFHLEHKPSIIISDIANYYGCFHSSTCFNKLDINAKDARGSMLQVMEASIRNQDLNESIGMMMQFQ